MSLNATFTVFVLLLESAKKYYYSGNLNDLEVFNNCADLCISCVVENNKNRKILKNMSKCDILLVDPLAISYIVVGHDLII